jgi:hypothetical protein
MASLKLDFQSVYNEVSRYLGWGSSPTGDDLTNAKAITHAGYRKFLYPIDLSTGDHHDWSFLIKDAVLETDADKWKYTLPTDFDKIHRRFIHDTSTRYYPPKWTSAERFMEYRSLQSISSYPSAFTVHPGIYDAEHGQFTEIWFYPTPNAHYVMHYAYIINPPQLSNATDYFVGGDFASEAILESALAVAELRWDSKRGVHCEEAELLIQKLIKSDTAIRPDYMGRYYDPAMRERYYKRYMETIASPYPNS